MQQEFVILPNWFRIHFIENEGMAYGLKFGGDFGKILLTLFRLVAVVIGFWYMRGLYYVTITYDGVFKKKASN